MSPAAPFTAGFVLGVISTVVLIAVCVWLFVTEVPTERKTL